MTIRHTDLIKCEQQQSEECMEAKMDVFLILVEVMCSRIIPFVSMAACGNTGSLFLIETSGV